LQALIARFATTAFLNILFGCIFFEVSWWLFEAHGFIFLRTHTNVLMVSKLAFTVLLPFLLLFFCVIPHGLCVIPHELYLIPPSDST
jgi:hypothetical protein